MRRRAASRTLSPVSSRTQVANALGLRQSRAVAAGSPFRTPQPAPRLQAESPCCLPARRSSGGPSAAARQPRNVDPTGKATQRTTRCVAGACRRHQAPPPPPPPPEKPPPEPPELGGASAEPNPDERSPIASADGPEPRSPVGVIQ